MPAFLTDAMPLTPNWWDIGTRIALTVVAGGLIGLDRERGGHAAGFRTTILVALAACLAMVQANLLLSVYGKTPGSFTQMDVLRFPLGVLTGVGFIGGGAILRRGDMMTGVTTAATLWFMTVVGLCFGGGQILTGMMATALAFIVLSPLKRLDTWLRCERKATLLIRSADADIPELSEALKPLACRALFVSFARTTDGRAGVTFELRWMAKDHDTSARAILNALSKAHDVADFSMQSTTN
ncbi:putative Mg2+ transporter-C (MgtC) family protein [Rhizobium sp. BK226]|uniref:MgtC/SapB family protein n=1 Tax=unclassified Rhizobium TaxID=2613769 RepID=UPI001622F9DD|nr:MULTISPECIES: MgtC/SapB family protein [unclassified Rhizobium]MBB3300951.1 putative Mg2+ transporter-C (MgtC) family protein [Rhizobium sp. BK112]MBB3368574.1 putative Mg2+ transporter-C (MgtC) family protein [Rhizobium sp. BK077]MBB3741531.1 putative Mg2+ transporter-C (MgtC) family protein [Rhizobium sp. BK591]MBB4112859.1 putative Mg2+ transporter-C (MgtC) family protein [Rhizobium sp. BK226]MBB4180841.1 putative Mg2+ transporter-C (MgtC) family protein [Rhizobium sp. BK109]